MKDQAALLQTISEHLGQLGTSISDIDAISQGAVIILDRLWSDTDCWQS